MINPPIALYYMQGLNTTPLHGHAALFGVYGMLGMGLVLFSVQSLHPGLVWRIAPSTSTRPTRPRDRRTSRTAGDEAQAPALAARAWRVLPARDSAAGRVRAPGSEPRDDLASSTTGELAS